ncbi:unnamed protein product [Dibothriocephalus latus]|uniref:SCP domain-containing protein n=1 Tax=Dibothriocephalus latus TaxID=60516 RepID=A0A3P7LBR1_DIBLA|nr:unnamed protein product [Dibothriocephalus latus]
MGVDRTFNSDALKAHNLLRALHGCEPIYYDDSLAQQAQAYAEKLSTKQRLLKSHQGNYGENVAVRTGLDADRLSGRQPNRPSLRHLY